MNVGPDKMGFLTLGADMAQPSRAGGKKSAAKTRKASVVEGRKPTRTKRHISATTTRIKGSRVSDLAKELKEAREQQAATAEILKVITSSPSDVQPVFEAIASSANRLLGGHSAAVMRTMDGVIHLAAFTPVNPAADAVLKSMFAMPVSAMPFFELLARGEPYEEPDMETIPVEQPKQLARARGYRSALWVPLMSARQAIGIVGVTRAAPGTFAPHEVQLLQTFADQAVIAIENARLFEELRDRQAELRVTFDNMGDGVAMFGDDTRLVAWNRNFQTILDLPNELVAQRPTYVDYVRILAERGEFGTDDIEGELNRRLQDTDRELRLERTRPDGRVIEVRRNTVPGGGFVLIYADITERKRAEQAIGAARDAAEKALRELQTAQASLVHAQKMAALGQVTAGIAHEIKNPLNFVNNFAGLSVELLDELKEAARAVGALDPGKSTEIVETIRMLTGNLEKIVEHGRRADGIVRSMLQHSRGSSDDRQPTDLNALAEEALNLAYHGARAQDPNFDIALEHDLDSNLAPVDVVPQELTRVLLNLIGNGFYAANKRSRESNRAYRPALRVTTREFGESVEVRVRDNGIGVPPENRDKLFQPFFTTKPTGEGTGLGLSISYEIITQQHGGTITVASEVGDFTEFTVRLPRRRHAVARGTA
jgi:two-component system, NtrC family, sensor kinase